MNVSYYNPESDQTVEVVVETLEQIEGILLAASALASGRGRPTVEILRDDGSSLAISTDGKRAFLVWVDSLGDSHHSVGGTEEAGLIFDYFGSWSEAPSDQLVPAAQIHPCVEAFINGRSPSTLAVLFTPE